MKRHNVDCCIDATVDLRVQRLCSSTRVDPRSDLSPSFFFFFFSSFLLFFIGDNPPNKMVRFISKLGRLLYFRWGCIHGLCLERRIQ